jgi:hypothetical protein
VENGKRVHGSLQSAEGKLSGIPICWFLALAYYINMFSRCRKAKYCGKECQSKAWSMGHRYWCSAREGEQGQVQGDLDQENDDGGGDGNGNNTGPSIGKLNLVLKMQ